MVVLLGPTGLPTPLARLGVVQVLRVAPLRSMSRVTDGMDSTRDPQGKACVEVVNVKASQAIDGEMEQLSQSDVVATPDAVIVPFNFWVPHAPQHCGLVILLLHEPIDIRVAEVVLAPILGTRQVSHLHRKQMQCSM